MRVFADDRRDGKRKGCGRAADGPVPIVAEGYQERFLSELDAAPSGTSSVSLFVRRFDTQ